MHVLTFSLEAASFAQRAQLCSDCSCRAQQGILTSAGSAGPCERQGLLRRPGRRSALQPGDPQTPTRALEKALSTQSPAFPQLELHSATHHRQTT